MSYYQSIYHIVIRTKSNRSVLDLLHSDELYRYMYGFVCNKKCHLYRINGVEDHIHLLVGLHPTIALSDFIRDLKRSSNSWIQTSGYFPQFTSWSEGYAALSYSIKDKDRIVNYIKKQREHHKVYSFKDEYITILKENEIEYDDE